MNRESCTESDICKIYFFELYERKKQLMDQKHSIFHALGHSESNKTLQLITAHLDKRNHFKFEVTYTSSDEINPEEEGSNGPHQRI